MVNIYNTAQPSKVSGISDDNKCITDIELQNCYIDSFAILVIPIILLSSSFCGRVSITITAVTSVFAVTKAGGCYLKEVCAEINEGSYELMQPQIQHIRDFELPYSEDDMNISDNNTYISLYIGIE
ncbi:hypothetical protein NF27_DT00450 [Candidatus Jidaibacter acanthamoeba]|uniref:Uncharacterized protein n=1 Tax=Candidatus Jidaibacter acanthamoebae TaxID=86105 RepID=A0A0C1MZ42_9RICK|nr:hypothetical protein [Candidatus Jidaibacter acanthamoeba]KIE05271.1 hypothetical protein NF27_DT00450 [Candidatus Jidaibacter acanthamoeba]